MSGEGYEPIPDIEEGGGDAPALTLKEKYPEASEKEAELLGLLDKCIDGPKVDLELPKVSAEDVETESSNFWFAVILPLLVALLILTGGYFLDPSYYYDFFPYVAAFLIFLASAPGISDRMMKQASFIFTSMDTAEEKVYGGIDGVATKVDGNVDTVQGKLHEVVAPWKSKLDKVTSAETALKKVDPSIDIPDPTDMERELDGATDEVNGAVEKVKSAIDVNAFVPGYAASPEGFMCQVVYPILFLCLVLQMVSAFLVSFFFSGSVGDDVTDDFAGDDAGLRRALWSIFFFTDDDDVGVVENERGLVAIVDKPLFLVAAVSYGLAFVQIALVYYFTRASSVAAMVNGATEKVADNTQRSLKEQGFSDVCEDVMGTRMTHIKTKTLTMITNMNKIESVMSKVPTGAGDVAAAADAAKKKAAAAAAAAPKQFSGFFGSRKKK